MKHKVGDTVKIKSRKGIDNAIIDTNDFGDTSWAEDMYDYCGEEHVIEYICNSTEYRLKGIPWFWTDDMFEDEIPSMEKPPTCFKMITQSTLTLEEACARVGGVAPDLNMTLGEFLDTYGRNGVGFMVLKEKLDEMNKE